MRPTGPLHLGHWLGALRNWVQLQDAYECYFMVADLHALMGEYENPAQIEKSSMEMVMDWLACGIDPEKSVLFVQSQIPEHAELAMILGMITPLGWLERNPTYKEQLREIAGRDLTTYGFLGYPVLQAADILLYKANKVPVGEDQLAHLELAREILRRFEHFYKKSLFPEPEALLTEEPRLLGIDRRKMSKSYGNAINLSDSEDAVRKKVLSMITDPERIKMSDPGHPEVCNVFSYYQIFADAPLTEKAHAWCAGAKLGCVDCKKTFAEVLIEALRPLMKRRREIAARPETVRQILQEGHGRAKARAEQTMREVKEFLHLVRI
ncbi:MAG: tryptophan--tRNA ligase [Candidatus Omnitrophica bacterium]|nr:tryptophan--tRNA ligase [Candidatus Omnitrophota bacterium]